MPTPAISASTRYINVGVTKVYYLPAVASATLVPTRAEMNAGTDITDEIMDWGGWTVSGSDADSPSLSTTFTGSIPGTTSAEDSFLVLGADIAGVDVSALLPRSTSGFVMWMDGGDVPTRKASVYPIRVRSNSPVRSMGNEVARRRVECSITDEPNESVTIPA